MMSLTRQVRQGAEEAFGSIAQGWRELKARAGSALTRFRATAKPDAGQEPVPFARWAFMAADVVEEDTASSSVSRRPACARKTSRSKCRDPC